MAYSEKLAVRIREIIAVTHKKVEEKKMFAGLCILVNDKMCIVVHTDEIMVRLNPDVLDEMLMKEGCKPMVMNGKMMKGYVIVNDAVLKPKKQLEYWIKLALEFNKIAKASKKKPTKKK